MIVDVDKLREPTLRLHHLSGVDEAWTLYSDETNNIRRLRLSEGGFNVSEPACFGLGGIVHAGPPRAFDVVALRKAIRAQPSATELKLKHIGTGGALDLLASPRLGPFLDWLSSEDLLAHWTILDPVHWSTVDIIDSIIMEGAPMFMPYVSRLKSDLTLALREDLNGTASLFGQFGYPDVQPETSGEFLDALIHIVANASEIDDLGRRFLIELLKRGHGVNDLPFIAGETAGVLIESFAPFYLHRFYLLPNAEHVLDTEPEIMVQIDATPLSRHGRPFRNHRFVDRSHDEIGIQVADILIGLLGKVFTWLRDNDARTVSMARDRLTGTSRQNHAALIDLIERSTDACPAFAHYVIGAEDHSKATIFLQPRSISGPRGPLS